MLVTVNGLIAVAGPPVKSAVVEVSLLPEICSPPLPLINVATVVVLPESDTKPLPPVKVVRLLPLPESASEPLPPICRLVAPVPPPRVPLKVVEPLAAFRLRSEVVLAALLMMLPPPPVPSASEATCWLQPARSSVEPEEMTSGVVTGRSLVVLGVETEAVPTTSSSE